VGCGDAGYLGVVVDRGHLDDVRADQVQAGEGAQHRQQLAAGQAAGFGGAGAGGERRVEHVDVDADVHGAVPDATGDRLDDAGGAQALRVGRGEHLEAQRGVRAQVVLAVQRAADADVQAAGPVDDALLRGPAERRAVRVRRAKVGVQGVEVRVEVHDRDRAVHRVDRAQQRQRDRVVAAEGQQAADAGAGEHLAGSALDRGDRLVDAVGVDRDVPGVSDLLGRERGDACRRVVRAQQPGGLPDVPGAEAGPWPVADPAVEGHSEDCHVGAAHLGDARQPRERRLADPAWHLGGIDGADVPVR
jgi:hypothetical protein